MLLEITILLLSLLGSLECSSSKFTFTGVGALIGRTSTITVTSNTTTITVPGTSIVRPTVVKTITSTSVLTTTLPIVQPVLVMGDDLTTQITRTNTSTVSTLVTATTASVQTILVDVTYTSTIWFTEYLNTTLPPNYGITATETTTLTATVTPTEPFSNLISFVNGIIGESRNTLLSTFIVASSILVLCLL